MNTTVKFPLLLVPAALWTGAAIAATALTDPACAPMLPELRNIYQNSPNPGTNGSLILSAARDQFLSDAGGQFLSAAGSQFLSDAGGLAPPDRNRPGQLSAAGDQFLSDAGGLAPPDRNRPGRLSAAGETTARGKRIAPLTGLRHLALPGVLQPVLAEGTSPPAQANRTASGAPPEAPHATLTIDPAAPAKEISPLLFGGFIEHFTDQIYGGLFEPGSPLADERGFRKDVIAAMKELRISVVRWPGGCFVSGYHWKDGVGRTRKPVADPVWGATDPNTFGTDEFVAWCRLVGCEPYICTNAGNGTPEEMQQWVEYCNATAGEYAGQRKSNGHEKPFNVKYWSIGNENYGPWEIGRKDADKWGPLVDQCARLMRAADPTIKLAAAATKKEEWSLPLLEAAGKHLDYVALHEYWFGYQSKNMMPRYQECIMRSEGPERTLQTMLGILDKAGCRGRVKIAFDEWNLRGWHHPGFPRKKPLAADDKEGAEFIAKREINKLPQQYSMADALFSASFFNACLRHCEDVAMTNIAPIVNTRGPLYVHPKGIVKRTTFHTLAMYANLLESRVAKSSVEASPYGSGKQAMPVIDAVATVDPSGKNRALALVNRHPDQAAACTVILGGTPLDGTFDATILAGDAPEAFNDVEHPARVVPERGKLTFTKGIAQLPPHSLTIVRFAAP